MSVAIEQQQQRTELDLHTFILCLCIILEQPESKAGIMSVCPFALKQPVY